MKNLLLTLFFLLFGSQVFSQQLVIKGVVTDERNAPLPGVNIAIQPASRGTATGPDGKFMFQLTAGMPVSVQFSMIGFQPVKREFRISSDTTITVVLQSITYMSGDIVVAASRNAELQLAVPQSVGVLQGQEMQDRNVLTLSDALLYVPGVQMAGNQVNIRGSSGFSYGVGSRVMLLLDGVPILGADTGEIRFDGLPMMMVERMEVIKGPGSALYGSGALGGIINLITKDFPEKREISVRSFVGATEPVGYATWRAGWSEGNAWRPFGGTVLTWSEKTGANSGFWLNGLYKGNSGWLEKQSEYSGELSGKFTRKNENGRFDFYGGYRRTERENYLYWDGLDNPLSIGRVPLNPTAIGGTKVMSQTLTLQPSYSFALSPKMALITRARVLAGRSIPINPDGNLASHESRTDGARYGGDMQFSWIPNASTNVVFGAMRDANAIFSRYYQSADSAADRSQPETGVYVQVKKKYQKLDINAGIRYDGYKIDGSILEQRVSPKISLMYELSSALLLRMSTGTGFRVPSVAERFINNQSYLPLKPNPDLKPELSTSTEVGIRSFFRLSGNWSGQFDAAVFWNEYQRLVEPQFVETLSSYQFQNLTSASIKGTELLFEAATNDRKAFFRAGYTFLNTEDKSTGKQLIFRSNHSVNASVGKTIFGRIQTGLDYRFASKPEQMDSDFSRFINDAEVAVAIHVLDGRIIVPFRALNSDWTFSLIGRNLTRYYYIERPAILAQPRNFQLQLQANF